MLYECFPTTHFSVAAIVHGMCSDEELFLTQNSFSEEILQHNFSIDSIWDGRTWEEEGISNTTKYKIYIVGSSCLIWKGSGTKRNDPNQGESGIALPQVNPDILNITDNEELNQWLSILVVEVRKKKDVDTVYPQNNLYRLCRE